MATPISIVVITYNEETNIGRCLQSVQWADDIVVVDSGSTDRTCDIAAEHGARINYNDWSGFGEQKRFATAAAKYDWVLNIDADEWLSRDLSLNIQQAIQEKPTHHVYHIRRRHYFMGKLLRHGISYPDNVKRLYNRKHANWNRNPVHESVCYTDNSHTRKTGVITGDMLHESAPTLGRYIEKMNSYTDIQASERHTQGKQANALQLISLPIWQFLRGYMFKLGFLDGIPGLVHNVLAAMNTFMRYAKLREKHALSNEVK